MNVKNLVRPIAPKWVFRFNRKWRWYKAYKNSPEVSLDDIRASLSNFSICKGESIFVHTSLIHMAKLKEPVSQIVGIVREMVGPTGNILMPTFSYTPTLSSYLGNSPIYDPKSSPTVMGLLNEMFRRSPGTVRSLHPTHSVAASGPLSEWLTKDHLYKDTPFHDFSPFARFEELNGKILFLGADHNANLTHVHVAEDILGDDFPVETYHQRLFPVRIRQRNGCESSVMIKAHNEHVFLGHDLSIVTKDLRLRRKLYISDIKSIKISCTTAKEVTQSVLRLAIEGKTIYSNKWCKKGRGVFGVS